MSLTMGTGPFGHAPAGTFNFDTPRQGAILLDVIPRRVRGLKDGETVVDSKRVHMLHESRILPVWYFPGEDVHMDLLRETGHTTHCPGRATAATTPSAKSRRRPGPIPSRSPAWSG